MEGIAMLDVARDGIVTFLKVAGPLMVVALLVGLVISLLQALTQIHTRAEAQGALSTSAAASPLASG